MLTLTLRVLILSLATPVLAQRRVYEALVDAINSNSSIPFNASLIPRFDYNDPQKIRAMSGFKTEEDTVVPGEAAPEPVPNPLLSKKPRQLQKDELPESLDWRRRAPRCRSIRMIRDQFSCSSCWAIAAMNSISDRICISQSNSTNLVERFISFQDPLSNCQECVANLRRRCEGGYVYQAFNFARKTGVVTGDKQGSNYCLPYMFSNSNQTNEPRSQPTCETVYPIRAENDRFFIRKIQYGKGRLDMMRALNNNGPIVVNMRVYEDFLTYQSGVYVHVFGSFIAIHAVRIVGYVTINDIPCWIVANSWGVDWGINGFAHVAMNQTSLAIETNYYYEAII